MTENRLKVRHGERGTEYTIHPTQLNQFIADGYEIVVSAPKPKAKAKKSKGAK